MMMKRQCRHCISWHQFSSYCGAHKHGAGATEVCPDYLQEPIERTVAKLEARLDKLEQGDSDDRLY